MGQQRENCEDRKSLHRPREFTRQNFNISCHDLSLSLVH